MHALHLHDPPDEQALLHDLGEVDEQSLSNEGERGVRESERCRTGQGRCEEMAGKARERIDERKRREQERGEGHKREHLNTTSR